MCLWSVLNPTHSFTHSSVLYCVQQDEMCRIGHSCERSKILEWSECSRKAGHKKWIKKRASDTLETWMPGAVVIGLFCTYLIPIQAAIVVEGLTEEWRVICVWLDQIWSIGSVKFGLSVVKSAWVNSQWVASPLLALLHLWLAYLTQVRMHLRGSIHTLLNPHTHEPIIFLHRLEVLCLPPCTSHGLEPVRGSRWR